VGQYCCDGACQDEPCDSPCESMSDCDGGYCCDGECQESPCGSGDPCSDDGDCSGYECCYEGSCATQFCVYVAALEWTGEGSQPTCPPGFTLGLGDLCWICETVQTDAPDDQAWWEDGKAPSDTDWQLDVNSLGVTCDCDPPENCIPDDPP
jgi:hypothetical protein